MKALEGTFKKEKALIGGALSGHSKTSQRFVDSSIRLAGQLAVGPRQVGCGGAVHAQQILRNPVIVSCSNKIDSRLRRVSFQSYLFINFTLWHQNTTTQKHHSLYNLLLRHPLYSPIWLALLWKMVRRRIANRSKAMFTGCFLSVKSVNFWHWP